MKNRSKKYFYIRKLMKFGFDKNVMNEDYYDEEQNHKNNYLFT